jgi:acetyltransferase-like isoleucine patch superfamily enzyme
MRLYIRYLRFMGVIIRGRPRYISPYARIDTHGTVEIGDRTIISDNVVLLTHDYAVTVGLDAARQIDKEEKLIIAGIRLDDNCFIGMNSIILPGSSVGRDVIGGAGTVIRGHIPEGALVLGNPATIIGRSDEWAMRRMSADGGKEIIDNSVLDRPRPMIVSVLG